MKTKERENKKKLEIDFYDMKLGKAHQQRIYSIYEHTQKRISLSSWLLAINFIIFDNKLQCDSIPYWYKSWSSIKLYMRKGTCTKIMKERVKKSNLVIITTICDYLFVQLKDKIDFNMVIIWVNLIFAPHSRFPLKQYRFDLCMYELKTKAYQFLPSKE